MNHARHTHRVDDRRSPVEMWAGVECAVVRIGDRYIDQVERNGHAGRLDDLERIAALGVRTVRYPILWERTAPGRIEDADWTWADERLGRLRELGIRPIVGLVHHGSGPRHTSLVDPAFPDGLARFAGVVAQRYPWVEDYTPVNEPLTTARFSGLYGHWYPHGRDDGTFARALVVQCRAVALAMAMAVIRTVTPGAWLVQTEDLGKTFSTPRLSYQADWENERRWLSLDLLCGRVGPDHPLWGYLRGAGGIAAAELEWFRARPCPPDLLGINYYPTSERYLDENLERYPSWTHGGNGRHAYADVEALRVCSPRLVGHRPRLRDAWERYRLPIAVTEAHILCTREEQMRWLAEAWEAATELRREGAAIRAVTLWSLFGAYDWNSLLTRDANFYEPGVFDLRAPRPRPTALAAMGRQLAAGRRPDHPVLGLPGWWRRPMRLIYGHAEQGQASDLGEPTPTGSVSAAEWAPAPARVYCTGRRGVRPVIIVGAHTLLGRSTARLCALRGLPYHLLTPDELGGADPRAMVDTLNRLAPWAIVNATGLVAGNAPGRASARRGWGRGSPALTTALATVCAAREVALLTFSSHAVFDGSKGTPYAESDALAPTGVMGRAQAAADTVVSATYPSALIARSGPLFSPWDDGDDGGDDGGLDSDRIVAHRDDVVSATYAPDLIHACLDLLIDSEGGVWHLANAGAMDWEEFVRRVGDGPRAALSEPSPTRRTRRAMRRTLTSERGLLLPPLDDAINRYAHERGSWPDDVRLVG